MQNIKASFLAILFQFKISFWPIELLSLWQVKSALADSYVAHTWGKFTRNKAREIFSNKKKIWKSIIERDFFKNNPKFAGFYNKEYFCKHI